MAGTVQENELTITLPPDLAKLVNERVASGRYPSAVEVVREAMAMMLWGEEQERKRDELRRMIAEGDRCIKEGRVTTKTATQILEEIRREKANGAP
jgi:putative addiction module CopG family antidote